MDLLVIFLFTVSFKASASPLEVNGDLLNDVDSLEVQGYEVHEKLSDRKDEGRPHVVTTTTVHRHSSTSQEGEGSRTTLGQTAEQKSSVEDNIGVYKISGQAASSETQVDGKEIVKIVTTNSHATPHNSVLSDSIKHSIGEDATYTHRPIIVRALTLSEVDNSSKDKTLNDEHYTRRQLSSGILKGNEDSSSVSSSVSSKDNNFDSGRSKYREIVRQPSHSSYVPLREEASIENHGSSYSREEEEESVLHTTVTPKVLVDHATSSDTHDETSVADVQRNVQGGYSRSDENQAELKSKRLSSSMLPSGTQNYLDHAISGDRVNLFPSQPQYTLDQNTFARYVPFHGEYFFNHNRFSRPFLSTEFDLEKYNSRPSFDVYHQPTLQHLEHTFRSPSKKESIPVRAGDAFFGRGVSNDNPYFSSYSENGNFAFGGIPFMRSQPSILSYPREDSELGLSEGFVTDLLT